MNLPKLKLFARRHWLPIAGFALSLGIAVWFGFTFLANAIYFNDPQHKDAALERWMTPRYVVLSYELPRSVVADVLGLTTADEGKRRRLGDVAENMDLTLDELTQKVRDAAQAYRESQR